MSFRLRSLTIFSIRISLSHSLIDNESWRFIAVPHLICPPAESGHVGLDPVAFHAQADIGIFGAKERRSAPGTVFVFNSLVIFPPHQVVQFSHFPAVKLLYFTTFDPPS